LSALFSSHPGRSARHDFAPRPFPFFFLLRAAQGMKPFHFLPGGPDGNAMLILPLRPPFFFSFLRSIACLLTLPPTKQIPARWDYPFFFFSPHYGTQGQIPVSLSFFNGLFLFFSPPFPPPLQCWLTAFLFRPQRRFRSFSPFFSPPLPLASGLRCTFFPFFLPLVEVSVGRHGGSPSPPPPPSKNLTALSWFPSFFLRKKKRHHAWIALSSPPGWGYC